MYTLWHTLNTPTVCNFPLYFCLCRASKSARDEHLGPSQVFSDHTHALHLYVAFQIPTKMLEFFKALYGHPIFKIFLFNYVWASLSFVRTDELILPYQTGFMLNNCH